MCEDRAFNILKKLIHTHDAGVSQVLPDEGSLMQYALILKFRTKDVKMRVTITKNGSSEIWSDVAIV